MKFIIYFFLLLSYAALAGCATGTFATTVENSSTDYLLLKEQADQAYAKKQYNIAETEYLRLTDAVPRDADAWFKLGNIYARTHKPEKAIKAYHEAILREPGLSKAWHNMGVVHMRQAANAFLSLQKHATTDDPLNDIALRRLNGLYELMPAQQAVSQPAVEVPKANEIEIQE